MTKVLNIRDASLRLLPGIAMLALLLTAPVLAMANTGDDGSPFIEHIQKKNSGVGFVILVSLQR